ncbi:MAG: hypothetical protein K6T68_06115, partial [Alicyclobacillus shizuokensis]|nr:hypothetical protein [Alicyclobacillus shizuokensis]
MVRGVGPRLVWLDRGGRLEMAVLWRRSRGSRRQRAVPVLQRVRVSNLLLPCYESVPGRVVFSAPLTWQRLGDGVAEAGPVFAILAGGRDGKFVGNRAHFRDLIRIARGQDQFVYVLPDDRVDGGDTWLGFVRVRSGVWRQLPCPQPQAVYNRIPQRHLERSPVAVRARQTLRERGADGAGPIQLRQRPIVGQGLGHPVHGAVGVAVECDANDMQPPAHPPLRQRGDPQGAGGIAVEEQEDGTGFHAADEACTLKLALQPVMNRLDMLGAGDDVLRTLFGASDHAVGGKHQRYGRGGDGQRNEQLQQ